MAPNFVTADLRFDIPAIKAFAKARYALKLDFINRYTGAPKRYWQIAQGRRAIRETWQAAQAQRHALVLERMPRELPYTAVEIERMAALKHTMACSPVSMQGNAAYRSAAGEYAQINRDVQARAYRTIIARAA